ncbi:MAG: L-carnitine dehydratase/bile acid-inducible protein [Actinomycetia bacterium]|nr:L-carnitine dehydratase/bile acid-inducible protein [Actinomycetes bacterium]
MDEATTARDADAPRMPLEGLRVLDLTESLAGAYCTKLLVDGGAEVVKVERPAGDPMRSWWASGRGDPPPGTGALFEWLSASKLSVVADLGVDEGRATVRDLVAGSDVVVESFEPGRIEALGFGASDLRALHPGCMLVSISDFGRGVVPPAGVTGVAATELTLQSLSGSVHARGEPGRFPVLAGGRLGEWSTGLYAAVGVLVALRRAHAGGDAEHVDVSRLESMAVTLVGYAALGRSMRGASALPYQRAVEVPCVERAKDGWIGFATVTNAQWQSFAVMTGQLDRVDGEWASLKYRLDHPEGSRPPITAWTSAHTVAEMLDLAADYRIPVAPVVGGADIADTEPFRSKGTFARPPTGRFLAPRPPYRFSKSILRPLGNAPALGAHQARAATGAQAPRSIPDAVQPFAGLRVVDFSAFWAVPYTTALLASLGADVVKVESTSHPDPMRFSSTAGIEDPLWYEKSAIYAAVNANKRGVTLALDTPEGRDLALRLVESADVVIENFTPRVMEQFGLDYPDFAAVRPDVVMVRVSAFGPDGPWRDRGGFAQTMEQITGMAWITGHADGPPLIPRGACDPISGMHALVATLMALEHRDRTGEGQLVEVSMVETAANVAAEIVIEASAYGRYLSRDGNHGPEGSPQGVYRCIGDDRWVALSVVDDDQWLRLRKALGDPEWGRDPALADVAGRRDRATEVDARLSDWTITRDPEAAAQTLLDHGVPAAVVMPADRIDEIPQLRARGFFIPVTHPVTGRHELPGWPFTFSGMEGGWPGRPAPTLGQHNQEILGDELGLGADDLRDLEARGIIGTRLRSD